jgi:hypothetical protein
MRFAVAIGLGALALLAGCGGDDEDEAATTQAPPPAEMQTLTRTETMPPESGPADPEPAASDEEQVKAVWRRYTKALGAEDGKAVCSLLTENGRREVLRGQSDGSSCEEVVADIGSFFKGFETELTDVKVQGDVAEGVSPERGQVRRQALDFRRVDGEWKIDGAADIE